MSSSLPSATSQPPLVTTVVSSWLSGRAVTLLAITGLLFLFPFSIKDTLGGSSSRNPAHRGGKGGGGGGQEDQDSSTIVAVDLSPPRCDCSPDSPKFISVEPCSGLVNQQYTIVHAALIASAIGAEVFIEDVGSRNDFHAAEFVDATRLPPFAFYDVPLQIREEEDESGTTTTTTNINTNENNENSKYAVTIRGELPRHLQTCEFPEDSYYRRKSQMSEVGYLKDLLGISCGVQVKCAFWGIIPSNDRERRWLVEILRGLRPSPELRALADAAITTLRSFTNDKTTFAAVHLRVEPDMNMGSAIPVPTADVDAALQRAGVQPGSHVYVASGIAEEIMDQLPSAYVWHARHTLLSPSQIKQQEEKYIKKATAYRNTQSSSATITNTKEGNGGTIEGFSAEALALIDLWICEASDAFVGDVRSTFSIAAAVTHNMERVAWYYGSLSMWAENAILLGLP